MIAVTVPIPGSWDSGNMTSSLIGPAQQWSSIHWHTSSNDTQPIDEYSIDIIGIENGGEETVVYEGLTTLMLLNGIPLSIDFLLMYTVLCKVSF